MAPPWALVQPWSTSAHVWRQAEPSPRLPKAKSPPVFRPSVYTGVMLTPAGGIDHFAQMPRRHLVEDFGLKPRDIAAFFMKNARRSFSLSVRRGGALLSLGHDGPTVVVANRTAWMVQRSGNLNNTAQEVQKKYIELVEMARPQQPEAGPTSGDVTRESVPFALVVAEALLAIYLDKISSWLQAAIKQADMLLGRSAQVKQDQASSLQLDKLRLTKQRFDLVQSQAKSFQNMLLQALEDEDDLMDLATSVGPTKEEWELCFEYYSQSAAELDAEVSAQLESMDDLENFWLLRLSARRLELEKSQLWLELLGVGLNCGAVISGIFGMNITSGLEAKRPAFFWRVCIAMVLFSGAVSFGLHMFVSRRLRQQGSGLMPNLHSGRVPNERRRFLRAARSF